MNHCDWCSLSEEDKQFQVYESKSWSVFLSDEQDYIGRCILVLKRHCSSMSELTDEEWAEMLEKLSVDGAIRTAGGASAIRAEADRYDTVLDPFGTTER